ncbi:DUF1963 domain-containing protein [Phytomonospora endophytica]|uniref:DUF1963 domain-containing protein n=1 Tax=Phytomonospora endophytica TaxID=714109 RepID=A0A841FGA7_9ACTN|nr:DUF1963 domain-containing protein [Phytomonospora endophytica]MBB6035286.1 hypothetical protein [Phytomonospora endophytica]GIG63965.1 hypothetical protein Pen01_02600 [Phytomonospora endophytica]
MDRETTHAAIEKFCADRVGAEVAAEFMTLARPGFALTPAADGRGTGHSRFGGAPLLTPGTPWPDCDGHPMSLIAVVDTDALAPWLDGVLPPGTGVLNFFCVDLYTDQAADDVHDRVLGDRTISSAQLGTVIAAPAGTAVTVGAPELASVFAAQEWAATPGFCLPDDWDPSFRLTGLDPYEMLTLFAERLADLREQPGVVSTGDVAFGWPDFPTGGSMSMELGVDPTSLHHLLQLDGGDYEYYIGGEGGIMHWSIPGVALAVGDFTKAIPTPDHF